MSLLDLIDNTSPVAKVLKRLGLSDDQLVMMMFMIEKSVGDIDQNRVINMLRPFINLYKKNSELATEMLAVSGRHTHLDTFLSGCQSYASGQNPMKWFKLQSGTALALETTSGRRWVKLNTDSARTAEGEAMSHCLDWGHPVVHEGRLYRYYSLRDAKGIPHVTVVECVYKQDGKRISQFVEVRGRANTKPIAKYQADIEELKNYLLNPAARK